MSNCAGCKHWKEDHKYGVGPCDHRGFQHKPNCGCYSFIERLPSVALVGKMGSGKSALADMLVQRDGFARHSWAEPVRQIAAMAYPDVVEDYQHFKMAMYWVVDEHGRSVPRTGREILQRIGTDAMRQCVDEDFWIKAGLQRIVTDQRFGSFYSYVNDDTRFVNEASALHKHEWVVIRLNVSEEVRQRRTGYTDLAVASKHASESEQDMIEWDVEVSNEGGIDDTYAQIRALLCLRARGLDEW